MRLRPRPLPPSPAPADRVRDLLSAGARGWVPAAEPGVALDGSAVSEGDTDVLTRLVHHGPGPARDERPPAPSHAPVQPLEDDRGVDDEPSGPGPDSSWQRPVRDPSATSEPDRAPGRSRLPRARIDPGWRGAVALVLVTLLAAVVAGGVVLHGRPQEVVAPEVVGAGVALPGASPQSSSPTETEEVVVAVAGEVARPGLVRLPAGSRVDDAVRAAGGPLPGADAGLLNLARKLVDGEQVLVGVDPPPGAPAAPGAAPGAGGGLLDLNAATAADLDALPGIGPVLAQRIVDWRTEHGRFASVEQLREVTGIGESKYADLQDSVTV